MNSPTEHFDNKAREWDANPVFQDRANKIAKAIRNAVSLSPSMTALDYGCGTGMLSFPLKDELGQISLKDTSTGMLEVLREKIAAQGVTNMTVRQTDLIAEPMPDESYDLIYSADDAAPHPEHRTHHGSLLYPAQPLWCSLYRRPR